MADIEVVINIPEEIYKEAKEQDVPFEHLTPLCEAIENGTPLPKEHGRIIDESKITSVEYSTEILKLCCDIDREFVVITGTDAPTIIKADKEE